MAKQDTDLLPLYRLSDNTNRKISVADLLSEVTDEGLWKEDGTAVTPKATGADLTIEGDITADRITITNKISIGENATPPLEGVYAKTASAASSGAGTITAINTTADGVNYIGVSAAGSRTFEVKEDGRVNTAGACTIKGDVAIGDSASTFLNKAAVISALTPEQRTTFAAAITAWNNRPEPYDAEDPTTLPVDTQLREAIVRVTTAGKINLNSDGSITAAGVVEIGDGAGSTETGLKFNPAGWIYATRANGSTDVFFRGYRKDTGDETITLNADGSSIFAGNIDLGTPTQGGAGDGTLLRSDGQIWLYADSDSSTTSFIKGFSGTAPKSLKFEVSADGSASFDGSIDSSSYITSSRFSSNAALGTNVNGTDYPFAVYDGSSNLYASISMDGSLNTAGNISAHEELKLTGSGSSVRINNNAGDLSISLLGTTGSAEDFLTIEQLTGNITAAGKITANSFDLESLPLLP